MSKQETKSEQRKPKQLAIFRQKRRGRQDTAFTVIDGRRIHLGVYGTPEAEKEYRRVVAEWNTGIIAAPKQTNTADITVAELVLRFLKERQNKVSPTPDRASPCFPLRRHRCRQIRCKLSPNGSEWQ